MFRIKKTGFDTLLIIRGLLALSVVIWHINAVNAETPAFINIPGRTAVWMFFGISGYVIGYGFLTQRYLLQKADLKKFYINRFLRIYPLFLLLSLITLVTEYFISGQILIKAEDIPSQFLMLQFNHTYVLSGVFWTLGIEAQFYIIAPLLIMLLYKKSSDKRVMHFAAYILFVLWVPFCYYFFGWSFDQRNLPANLSHFFIGMIGCSIILDKRKPVVNNNILLFIIIAIICVTNYFYRDQIRLYWTIGSVMIDVAILAAILLHSNLEKKEITGNSYILRFFILSGLISYGVYAWHPYLTTYIPLLSHNTLAAVMITVIIAFLSYQFFEWPILQMKKRTRRLVP